MGKAPLDYLAEALQTKSDKFHGQLVPLSYLQALAAGIIGRINELDKIKKALFYGKSIEGFDEVEFAITASCDNLPASVHANPEVAVDLIHGIIGKVTEAGEQLEALMRTLESPFEYIDATNLLEEVGDGQWYDAIICAALGSNFDRVQQTNIDKLRARFPDKFSEYDANNRDLGVERQILENSHSHGNYAIKLGENDAGQTIAMGVGVSVQEQWPKISMHKNPITGRLLEIKYFENGVMEHWVDGQLFVRLPRF